MKKNIPTVQKVGFYQPYFVIYFLFFLKNKTHLSIKEIQNFAYDPIRFDVIRNHQQIDWEHYTNITQFLSQSGNYISKADIQNIVKNVKIKKEIKKEIVYTDSHFVSPMNIAPIYQFSKIDSRSNNSIMTFNRFIRQRKIKEDIHMMRSVDSYSQIKPYTRCIRPWFQC